MANNVDLRMELDKYKYDEDSIHKSDLTEKELEELLQYRQLSYLRSIKNGIKFFVVLAIILMVVGVLTVILEINVQNAFLTIINDLINDLGK